jgi:SP family myo-inositol transporter-like MFS transporter 13
VNWVTSSSIRNIPSIVLACLLAFIPQSLRQLIVKGREEEAAAVSHRVCYKATPAHQDVQAEAEHATVGKTRWQIIKELHTNSRHFRALVIACDMMVVSQMSGFNTLM